LDQLEPVSDRSNVAAIGAGQPTPAHADKTTDDIDNSQSNVADSDISHTAAGLDGKHADDAGAVDASMGGLALIAEPVSVSAEGQGQDQDQARPGGEEQLADTGAEAEAGREPADDIMVTPSPAKGGAEVEASREPADDTIVTQSPAEGAVTMTSPNDASEYARKLMAMQIAHSDIALPVRSMPPANDVRMTPSTPCALPGEVWPLRALVH
jgi:hypothetical protein